VSREIIEHGKAAEVLPKVRHGAVMLVLARVGLSMPKCGRDRSDYILLTTFGVAAQEFGSLGSTRRTRFDENPTGVSSSLFSPPRSNGAKDGTIIGLTGREEEREEDEIER
jgi:hypothetical protein